MAPTKNVRDLSRTCYIYLYMSRQIQQVHNKSSDFHVFVTNSSETYKSRLKLFTTALRNRCGHYIFVLFLPFFFSSPNLSGQRLDVYHTLTHGVALERIQNAGLNVLKMQDPKKSPKIAILASSHKFVRLYLRKSGMYRQSEKKLVKQQYLLYTSPQYGELRPTSG